MKVRLALIALLGVTGVQAEETLPRQQVLPATQLAMAKLYGAGRIAGLEGYQSGFFIAGERAAVLTIDNAVLEGDVVTVIDAYGERCEARVVGRDAATGLALAECPETFEPPAALDLSTAAKVGRALPVWVLSNAFNIAAGDEPVSVQRGRIAAVAPLPLQTDADAYRPAVGVPEPGTTVLLLDAVTSNPGAGGGVVVDHAGALLGVIGAECRSPVTGAWINYAIPLGVACEAVERVRDDARGADPRRNAEPSRHRAALAQLGFNLIPAITARTPAYVERVDANSPAGAAGVEPDDMIVAVGGATVGTVETAGAAVARDLTRTGVVELTLLRGNRLVTISLQGDAP